jgi:hypothetical protein
VILALDFFDSTRATNGSDMQEGEVGADGHTATAQHSSLPMSIVLFRVACNPVSQKEISWPVNRLPGRIHMNPVKAAKNSTSK